jgi:hypothetical protein
MRRPIPGESSISFLPVATLTTCGGSMFCPYGVSYAG